MKGFVTAVRTLSILPVPGKECSNCASSLPWFPVAGLLLGGILAGIGILCRSIPADATAAILLTAGVLLTRGFHLDGLADCADGFGGGYTRERVLEIMKDSSIGVFGAAAVSLSLIIKFVAFRNLAATGQLGIIVTAYTVSRALQVEQMVRLPYARATGTAELFVKGAKPVHRLIALTTAAALAVLLSGAAGVVCLTAAWLASFCFGRYCKKRIGGITGDLLGAGSELAETLVLFLPIILRS